MEKQEYRILIKHCFLMGKTSEQSLQWLQKCYPTSAPSRTTVYRWFSEFKMGRISTEDAELINPYFFEESLNGQNYVRFLREQLGYFLVNIPLMIRLNMWFMHDGAPAHFSRIARHHLNRNYGQRCIGRGGPITWP
ncbi:hypothetical protein ALC57_14306 [Trachymyrmex cornetzi]|uniref:Mos1 transposase HTH domain-containing protein n=1 Tax=Trachymyrmex cornetzi TaxID=471704 RepID=A0A151IYD5_9HYME|nr:hypothetical protein ALC57_14306 [Trachymyrmex cornetzi]